MENTKILFEYIGPDGNYAIESAWATPVGSNFRLDNILFYAREYALNDILRVEQRNDELFVVDLVEASGHSTIRILFNNVEDVKNTRKKLREMGCESELSDIPILVSVDIPPEVEYFEVEKYLIAGENESKWEYEEACIAHEK